MMSGFIVACARPGTDLPFSAQGLGRRAARLSPDNITPRSPLLLEDQGLVLAVVNPISDLPTTAGAICLGAFVGAPRNWSATGSQRPDGSYAVCRFDADRLQLVTDNLASRTVWYVLDGDMFLASTSQRALVCLLGDLRLNHSAVAWLASSGTLGPDNAWDTRLQRVPAAAVLSLDRRAWTTQCTAEEFDQRPEPLPDEVHLKRWRDAILETCAKLDVSLDTWLLPLSGGLDSRTLLAALIEGGRRPRCVTWGLRRSLEDPRSDAGVARLLAEHHGVDHVFLPTDPVDEPARVLIDRFLVAGEGRTDQIAGYIDGLAVWKALFDQGVAGVIRGDEPGWGEDPCFSPTDARRSNGMEMISDFPAAHLITQLGLAKQSLPEWAEQRSAESLILYDNRLTNSYFFPLNLGPLNDVKCAYVEVANPLISDRIMNVARALPEGLRYRRRGFEAVASALGPQIPEATRSALAGWRRLLSSSKSVTEQIIAELSSTQAERICERQGLDRVVSGLREPGTAPARQRLRSGFRAVVPAGVRARINPDPAPMLSTFTLALRLYLASRMVTLLTADAAAVNHASLSYTPD